MKSAELQLGTQPKNISTAPFLNGHLGEFTQRFHHLEDNFNPTGGGSTGESKTKVDSITVASEPLPINLFTHQTYQDYPQRDAYRKILWDFVRRGVQAVYLQQYPEMQARGPTQFLLVLDRTIARQVVTSPDDLRMGIFDPRLLRQRMSPYLARTIDWNPFLSPEQPILDNPNAILHERVRGEMTTALHVAERATSVLDRQSDLLVEKIRSHQGEKFDLVEELVRYSTSCMMEYLGAPVDYLEPFVKVGRDFSYLADYYITPEHQLLTERAMKIFYDGYEKMLEQGYLSQGIMGQHIDKSVSKEDQLALLLQLQILGMDNAAGTLFNTIVGLRNDNAQHDIFAANPEQNAKLAVRAAVKAEPTLNYVLRTVANPSGYTLDNQGTVVLPPFAQVLYYPFVINNPTQEDAIIAIGNRRQSVSNYGLGGKEDIHFCPGARTGELIAVYGLLKLEKEGILNNLALHWDTRVPWDGTFFNMPKSLIAQVTK